MLIASKKKAKNKIFLKSFVDITSMFAFTKTNEGKRIPKKK
jgi:hypothetical protein|tara:strand:+ start:83 stop:205 length:123 start_codon:yes stop_codon:yes gene_type:complete